MSSESPSSIVEKNDIIDLPVEIQQNIFEVLNDRETIVNLAKTRKQLYDVYKKLKELRLLRAERVTKKVVGVFSPTIMKTGIMLVYIMDNTWPTGEQYLSLYHGSWEMSAMDVCVINSPAYDKVLRQCLLAARYVKLKTRYLWPKVSSVLKSEGIARENRQGVPRQFAIHISARELGVHMQIEMWLSPHAWWDPETRRDGYKRIYQDRDNYPVLPWHLPLELMKSHSKYLITEPLIADLIIEMGFRISL